MKRSHRSIAPMTFATFALMLSPLSSAHAQDESQSNQNKSPQQTNDEANGQSDSPNPQSQGETDSSAITFDFKDPKGVNSIGFFYNSELEPVVGLASGVAGEISFNPQKPESFSGEISVDSSSLTVANEKMTKDLHSEGWLNAEKFPRITFQFNKIQNVKRNQEDGSYSLTVQGRLGLHGATVQKTVPINVMYYEGRAPERGKAESGDLLMLRSTFKVSRADFGIKPEMDNTKVGREVGVVVAIAGYGPPEGEQPTGETKRENQPGS